MTHLFNRQKKISLFTSLVNLRYRDELSSLNAIQFVGGAAGTLNTPKSMISLVNLSGYSGKSLAIYANGNDKYLAGGRFTSYFKPIPFIHIHPSVSAGLSYSSYLGESFGIKRKDGVVDFTMGLRRRVGKSWDISAKTMYVSSNSTVNLYDYDRLNASLSIKRTF